MSALTAHRIHFAFTITYHYLFPQLTMGLGLLLVVLKTLHLRGNEVAGEAARFWSRIFGVTFVMGVVTGIPMEFQLGASWSRFSSATGGVIGHALAMEGVFAFFLESAFIYLMLYGEKRVSPRMHWGATLMVFLGSWLSGYFIIVTNAFMHHPVGHAVDPDGSVRLVSIGAFLTNPWALVEYAHTMVGSCITASFVMAAVGAFYTLQRRHPPHAALFLRVGVTGGLLFALLAAAPTGDLQMRAVVEHQPATFAAMEGHFHTEDGAALVLVGQPNEHTLTLDNPIAVPHFLSLMTHQRWHARVRGLTEFDRSTWPDNVPLLYYGYHLMVGLGTIFVAVMGAAALLLWRRRLSRTRAALWVLMLAAPLPFVANTAGWMTTELGRQPWLVYGLMRTADGVSPKVSSGNALFTLLGYMGLYVILSMAFFFVVTRILAEGPSVEPTREPEPEHA
ncbi:MAG: cytochrome ubiquinol oxidase subunit I [Myxococcales bacterium]|nr:cytochrome ubiquinol oxidase subunit I [Myxococcales bacterium]